MGRQWPELDPEFSQAMEDYLAAKTFLPAGDVDQRRRVSLEMRALLAGTGAPTTFPGVRIDHAEVASVDGWLVPLTVIRPEGEPSGSAYLFVHGGGIIMGDVAGALPALADLCRSTGMVIVSPDYRLAPEAPYPTPLDDCYAALEWVNDNLAALGASADRILVGGDSAGGGLAAGVVLRARDLGGPRIAAQVLGYPMLDDRTTVGVDPREATWRYADNETGWRAYLGAAYQASEADPHAVPGRAKDLSGLPRTFIDTSTLDLFCDENVDFARRLWHAGVSCELHVYPGVPHAFEDIVPEARLSRLALANRLAFLRSV